MARPHAVAIDLSEADRAELQRWARRRKTAQALTLRSRIVLACTEPGVTNTVVAAKLGVSLLTVLKWRRRFARLGPAGLNDAPRSGAPRSIRDEQVEAVVRTTLEFTPENATHWSSRILAARLGLSQSAVLAHLESVRVGAAPQRRLQAVCGPAPHGQGARHRRAVPAFAQARTGALRR